MATDSTTFTPPFIGIIETTHDALICFEAARRSLIPRITRRLQRTEKGSLIQSGSVFVFDEKESGVKRWTDGVVWSPSRILGNFLIYRETTERSDRHHLIINPPHRCDHESAIYQETSFAEGEGSHERTLATKDKFVVPRRRLKGGGWTGPVEGARELERERELVGSLTTSYKFKTEGLIKKTISVSIKGAAQHLVSYYSMKDALSGRLRSPSSFPELASLAIHPDFLSPLHFRFVPRAEVNDRGVIRYVESVESVPPARTTFVADDSSSFHDAPSSPFIPLDRSATLPHLEEVQPLLRPSLLHVASEPDAYFPSTKSRFSTFELPPSHRTHFSRVPSPPRQSRPSFQRSQTRPQPKQRQQNLSHLEVDASDFPPPSSWYSFTTREGTLQGWNLYGHDGRDWEMGNENGEGDGGEVGGWDPSEQQQQQQQQHSRPSVLRHSNPQPFSHLANDVNTPSHRRATHPYLSPLPLRPVFTNRRLIKAIPTFPSPSSSTDTTPSQPSFSSPPFAYASSSTAAYYQDGHHHLQYYQYPSPPFQLARPLPHGRTYWSSSSGLASSPHFSSFSDREEVSSQNGCFDGVYSHQGGGEGVEWEVPAGGDRETTWWQSGGGTMEQPRSEPMSWSRTV